jgi:hypothetical protein
VQATGDKSGGRGGRDCGAAVARGAGAPAPVMSRGCDDDECERGSTIELSTAMNDYEPWLSYSYRHFGLARGRRWM